MAKTKIIPLSEWDQHHPWPTVGSLREKVQRNYAGITDACVIRCGRRVLIDEERFHAWARGMSSKKADQLPRARGARPLRPEPIRI